MVWYESVSGGTSRRYLHADHQGSIIAVADQNGNPIAINAYDEWGIPNASNLGRFGYTGQAWLPELGMWYYKARLYSPTLGRFLQTDPVGYKDQINLYAYVGNDPVDDRDPTGAYELAPGTDGTKFESYRQKLIEARDKYERGSDDYARIDASLRRIGEPNTKGITVMDGGTNAESPASAANISADGKGVLTIYTNTVETLATMTHTNAAEMGAAVIGHEADPVHSGGFTTREGRMKAEISGYTTEDAVNRAFGNRVGPSNDRNEPDRQKRIEDSALMSVLAACKKGGDTC